MTEPSHSDIFRAIGTLEGRLEGIEKGIRDNAERSGSVDDKVSEMHTRVSRIELWKAEVRGMGLGLKAGLILSVAAVSAGLTKAVDWVVTKMSW